MSRLKVLLRGAIISEIKLTQEREYVGGRKEGCDIRLQAEKGISREHFQIKYQEGIWKLSALSRFGDIYSGGQKIEQLDLVHGLSFQIPPYEFTYSDVAEESVGADRSMLGEGTSVTENEKTVIGVTPQVPHIKMVNAKGQVTEMLRLEVGNLWVAGRDPSCQIIIPDQRVSRRQFEIYKVNGAYTILDLASVNGTFLNGSPISTTDPQTLKSGDSINVLDNVMYFELHDPNFQYKMDKIDLPPMQIEEINLDEVPEEQYEVPPSEYIEEFADPNVGEQLNVPANGVFTGIHGDNFSNQQQQFYTFANQNIDPVPEEKGIKKFFKNKVLMATIVLALLGGAYLYNEQLSQPDEAAKPVVNRTNGTDPFSKLSLEQQKEVEDSYNLAEEAYNQQKYELAIEKIKKIKEILPTGYKDSEQIELESEKAIFTFVENKKDEELRKEKAERDAKNKEVLDACEKKINPNITAEEIRQCVAPVVAFDPNSEDVTRLIEIAEKLESEKEQRALDLKNKNQLEGELKKLFAAAEDIHKDGLAFKAINKYNEVVKSDLPDPNNLKKKAKQRIAFIESKIEEKTQNSLALAETMVQQSKLKDAVKALREAQQFDPNNKKIKDQINLYIVELKRQMREIYQESVIDENYGVVDSTETKQGAKDKWKKITELDIEDGEYYRKAVVKLRKYGVF